MGRVVSTQCWKGNNVTVCRFLGSVIQGCTELEELRDKTSVSAWGRVTNKLAPYVVEQGELEGIVFLTPKDGIGKRKTHTFVFKPNLSSSPKVVSTV